MKKLIFLLVPVVLLTLSAPGLADNLAQSMANCKRIADDQQRLTCFDAISSHDLARMLINGSSSTEPVRNPPRGQAVAAQKRPQQVVASAPEPVSSVGDFGLDPKTPEAEVDEITATIIDISENARGKLFIKLDNGTRWEQKDNQHLKLSEGMTVSVERGILGAFYLSHDGSNRRIKVKRTQ
ncbi:hypothetical protein [Alteromonas lipolytica]|uniref:Uncharacterized protein n=1 Tax=Alteromonas lipolytica TaxID=1856405 RepID=A0A1E8F908_9ALTE|nr:hypothetical protein [Alteromonas lipolytica]OFI32409.1 hypothetical protein BFC17_06750 [Alteromonas lipolytica]GGF79928.1 hypothetical protein GCM10011338_35340 [Alteromonas lipolytica]